MNLKLTIKKLLRKEDLSPDLCQQVLEEIIDPSVNPLQVTAFLIALRAKAETAEELTAFLQILREKMIRVPTETDVLDIVGTGGDGFNTVNISTGSAILAASCGVKVAKHGNRALSSQAGSADVLEALGINIHQSPAQISRSIDEIGIGFCYAPNFHPTTSKLSALRKELNIHTTFNLLGPLLNPAHAAHLLLGVMDEALLPIMAEVLIQTGTKRSIIMHGCGLDEISSVGPVQMIEVFDNEKRAFIFDPADFGFARCTIADLRGSDALTNAALLRDTLRATAGPIADAVILNAAVGLYLYGAHASIADAIGHARENLYNGLAFKLLHAWREFTNDE